MSEGPNALGFAFESTYRIFVRVSDLCTSAASPMIDHRQVSLSNLTACSASSTSRPRTYSVIPWEVPDRMIGVSTQPARPNVEDQHCDADVVR
jgi:hypothetical protein